MRKTLDEAISAHGNFNIVSGMGDDSTKMIAALYLSGYEPNSVIFCDTGNEMPHTYKFMAFLSKWMMERNWSKLIVVKKRNANNEVINVYDENYKNGRMPPVTYGFKTCSQRFKIELANKTLAQEFGHGVAPSGFLDEKFLAWRKRGGLKQKVSISEMLYKYNKSKPKVSWKGWDGKIVKAVGLNADEDHRVNGWIDEECFETVYPLYDMGIGNDDGEDLVEKAGLYLPGKSSCFMCSNMTADEIVYLHDNYPLKFHRALAMEFNVVEHGNDFANVDRLFIVGGGIDEQLPTKMAKKIGKKLSIEESLSKMSKETKIKLGLESGGDQNDLFGVPATRLEIRNVKEPTNFIGLARNKSWADVVRYYQMTGQMDLSVGGDMCPGGACGL